MARQYGSRMLLATCVALAVLLAALAAVQYRWSARVASADAQREREHLYAAAALFTSEFNGIATQAMMFLQNDAWAAIESGKPLAGVPKLLGEMYYLESVRSEWKIRKLTPEGLFAPASLPEWAAIPHCSAVAIKQPLALVAPVFDIATTERDGADGTRIVRAFGRQAGRCFVARLDEAYLRETLFPQLIRRSFGGTSAGEYDFAVVSQNPPPSRGTAIYGSVQRPDLRKTFFSVMPADLAPNRPTFHGDPAPGQSAIIVQRVESTIVSRGSVPFAPLFGPGILELDVAHKGVPLAVAFDQTRRRELMLSMLVEVLLLAAIVFLVVASRRIERLSNQKMQFVAGVSHELRTPVSAISMLARNQADGLVTGPERVKQYGELIHQQSRRLNEMVEQTLQYAGIHSGLRPRAQDAVDPRNLIEEAVEARRAELARAGFEVELALDADLPAVQGDAQWLRTAVDNLLSNAQKHANGGHWIRVSAGYSAREKEVRISVEDRGAGIDPADQAEIFEPFCRGRAAVEAQIPGSGLGLSLVRSAAEAHHGSVTLVSEPGRGSIFTLHLPV
jgi:two-component system sensor histidine kinase SenX3